MPNTYTGLLVFEGSAVSIENGPLLAEHGADPVASAARDYATWGQTSPVTVIGDPGFVDGESVLFVTKIGWAKQAAAATVAFDEGGVQSVSRPVAKKAAAKKKSPAAAAKKKKKAPAAKKRKKS